MKLGHIRMTHPDPVRGHEQAGTRPCVVVQNDPANRTSPVTIVAAITSSAPAKERPTDVWVEAGASGLTVWSRVTLNQIRTVDMEPLGVYVGRLSDADMGRVDEALKISLGLVRVQPRGMG